MRPKASAIDLYRLSSKSQKAPVRSLGIPNESERLVVLKYRRLGYLWDKTTVTAGGYEKSFICRNVFHAPAFAGECCG